MFLGIINDDRIVKDEEMQNDNHFTDYCIWHVDIKKYGDIFIGLFDYIEKPGAGKTKLFYGISHDGMSWEIKQEIIISKNKNDLLLYKSTSFIKDKSIYLIVSGIDKHYRWFLYHTNLGIVL